MNNDKLQKITSAIESEIEAFGEVMDVSELRSLQKKLEKFLITDPVTGILNRWKIEDVLEREYNRAKGKNGKLCVIMIDIDKFKKINDIQGHNVGDFVLRQVASCVEFEFEGSVGKSHYFGRWGGDEFVYIIPSITTQKVKKIIGNIICRLKDITYNVSKNISHSVAISAGAAWIKKDDTKVSLFNRADKLMYKAKKNGGKRIELVLD